MVCSEDFFGTSLQIFISDLDIFINRVVSSGCSGTKNVSSVSFLCPDSKHFFHDGNTYCTYVRTNTMLIAATLGKRGHKSITSSFRVGDIFLTLASSKRYEKKKKEKEKWR